MIAFLFSIISLFPTDDEDDKKSRKILAELENIDDECDDLDIDFVKISDEDAARDHDVSELPSLIYFQNRFPRLYEGEELKRITNKYCLFEKN